MKLYLLLSSGGKVSADPADRAAAMKELNAWYAKIAANLVDSGAAFTPNAKTVASDGKIGNATNGAKANGFSLIKAESLDAAVSIAQGYPLLKRGFKMTVYETFRDAP